MHDLDRTLRTYDSEADMELDTEYDELDTEYDQEYEYESGAISEEEENELAEELLTLSSEAELDQFLGKLFKKIGGVAKKLAPLGKLLKPIAKKLLPIAGTAAGAFFGGPIGAKVGGTLGNFATKLFELEADFEYLPPREQQLEAARRFVRLATEAAQQMANGPDAAADSEPTSEPVDTPASEEPPDDDPDAQARTALTSAASVHAPGLAQRLSQRPAAPQSRRRNAGRWYRRGNIIVVRGA
jgi:hypothetical protein